MGIADTQGRSRPATTGEREAQHRRTAARELREAQRRQREEYGGLSWASAFFGWLVAVGIAVLLVALLSAAGAAVGLTQESPREAAGAADTIGIVGGILLLAVLVIAYYAGGYVAGRMARFNGPRQGFAVWLLGLIATILLAVAGVLLGAEYNVLESLNLPRIPVDEGSLTTGGLIALAAIVAGTLLAAVAGGKAGSHYHRKVDRVGPESANGRSTDDARDA
jgi:MFS family permease